MHRDSSAQHTEQVHALNSILAEEHEVRWCLKLDREPCYIGVLRNADSNKHTSYMMTGSQIETQAGITMNEEFMK